jgi:serine/threonine-protein kinase
MVCPHCQGENDDAADTCFSCGKPLAYPITITRGSVIAGRYEILSPLGKGGMGMVYKAHDHILDETVALKTLRADVAREMEIARRFLSETKLARRVRHKNVCGIHEYGEESGLRYIAMEFVDGTDLRRILRQKGRLQTLEAFDVTLQIARGLQAIHQAGIIHRDLKTTNIMLDSDGLVRVMDFGIAKQSGADATLTGQVVGTPEYMSPEQARGHNVDFRSDVYALGVVIYEVFTGRVPFSGDTPIATILKHLHDMPPLDSPEAAALPRQLVPALRRALAKEPGQRFANARDVVEALQRAREAWQEGLELEDETPTAATPSPLEGLVDAERPTEARSTVAPGHAERAAAAAAGDPASFEPPTLPFGSEGPAGAAAGQMARTQTDADAAPSRRSITPVHVWALAATALAVVVLSMLVRTRLSGTSAPAEASFTASPLLPAPLTSPSPQSAEPAVPPVSTPSGPAAQASASPSVHPSSRTPATGRASPPTARATPSPGSAATASATPSARSAGVVPIVETTTPPPPERAPPPATPSPVEATAAPRSAPVPQVRRGDLVEAGAGVVPPQLLSEVRPDYPSLARRLKRRARVLVRVLVNDEGKVAKTELVQGDASNLGFNEAALDAASKCLFRPATKYSVPVSMWFEIPVTFTP